MSFLRSFLSKKPKPDQTARDRLHIWAEAVLGQEGLSLTISEVECGDPACPGLETIMLVMLEGEPTQAVKIRKPIAEIAEADIQKALAGFEQPT